MADISKINAVLLANIAEIDDVLAANIAKVNGLVFTSAPAFSGLLDDYSGAAAAYSTRRLNSAYTGAAMRVREDGTDTETDIGFDSNGDLDTAAIATHCGSANGYVSKWYDQSQSGGTGSGTDADQTTAASQPQIYDGASVITENGQPSCKGGEFTVSAASQVSQPFTVSAVSKRYGTDTSLAELIRSTDVTLILGHRFGGYTWRAPDFVQNLSVSNSGQQNLIAVFNGASSTLHGNSSSISMTDPGDNNLGVTQIVGEPTYFLYQELVVWSADQSTNRSGIEGNINAHYQIGNFGTPTSGLLATYTGAAAAYSVRQLANTAALAMRVREDGTDTELDIGFDSNGDLDTAAIASHCGANNGYVVTWYDQSGNQVDVTQSTTGDQPQIYNGTSVITENGKSALDFAGTGFFTATLAAELSQPNTYSSVAKTESGQIRSTLSDGYSNRNLINYANASGVLQMFAGSAVNGSDQRGSQNHLFALFSGSSSYCYVNGTQDVSGNVGADGLGTQLDIGAGGGTGSPFNELHGNIQEWIVWNSNQDTNRSGIQTDINTYFSIYT